ncbi:XlyB, partial [bacterium]|nr:XlyB [bacterium]
MAYTRRQQWLPANRYALKAPHAMKAEFVTIHNTANDASAANEIAYMLRNSNATSYHVAIDDKEAIEAIPFARNAWHAGDGANGPGNRKSIGIEICYSKSGGKRYEEAEANAIEYTAHALVQLGLPASAVKFHQEWSGKNCPHRILDEKRGNAFKQAIAKRVNELKNPKPVQSAAKPQAPQDD